MTKTKLFQVAVFKTKGGDGSDIYYAKQPKRCTPYDQGYYGMFEVRATSFEEAVRVVLKKLKGEK